MDIYELTSIQELILKALDNLNGNEGCFTDVENEVNEHTFSFSELSELAEYARKQNVRLLEGLLLASLGHKKVFEDLTSSSYDLVFVGPVGDFLIRSIHGYRAVKMCELAYAKKAIESFPCVVLENVTFTLAKQGLETFRKQGVPRNLVKIRHRS